MDSEELNIVDDLHHLKRLKRYLNYELSTTVVLFLALMYPVAILVMAGAAILTAPYMAVTLYKFEKFGWVTSLAVIIVAPLVLIIITGAGGVLQSVIFLSALALFYMYCGFLRFSINDWIESINARRHLQEQRIAQKSNEEIFWSQFEDKEET